MSALKNELKQYKLTQQSLKNVEIHSLEKLGSCIKVNMINIKTRI